MSKQLLANLDADSIAIIKKILADRDIGIDIGMGYKYDAPFHTDRDLDSYKIESLWPQHCMKTDWCVGTPTGRHVR